MEPRALQALRCNGGAGGKGQGAVAPGGDGEGEPIFAPRRRRQPSEVRTFSQPPLESDSISHRRVDGENLLPAPTALVTVKAAVIAPTLPVVVSEKQEPLPLEVEVTQRAVRAEVEDREVCPSTAVPCPSPPLPELGPNVHFVHSVVFMVEMEGMARGMVLDGEAERWHWIQQRAEAEGCHLQAALARRRTSCLEALDQEERVVRGALEGAWELSHGVLSHSAAGFCRPSRSLRSCCEVSVAAVIGRAQEAERTNLTHSRAFSAQLVRRERQLGEARALVATLQRKIDRLQRVDLEALSTLQRPPREEVEWRAERDGLLGDLSVARVDAAKAQKTIQHLERVLSVVKNRERRPSPPREPKSSQ
jgi:hypothetical protein